MTLWFCSIACCLPGGRAAPGAKPTSETWGLQASAWARQGETARAAHWLQEAAGFPQKRLLHEHGITTQGAFQAMSSFGVHQSRSLGRSNSWSNHVTPPRSQPQMVEMKLQPSSSTLAVLLSACAKSQDSQSAAPRRSERPSWCW